MQHKIFNRVLSILLSLCLTLTLMPMQVLAEEYVEWVEGQIDDAEEQLVGNYGEEPLDDAEDQLVEGDENEPLDDAEEQLVEGDGEEPLDDAGEQLVEGDENELVEDVEEQLAEDSEDEPLEDIYEQPDNVEEANGLEYGGNLLPDDEGDADNAEPEEDELAVAPPDPDAAEDGTRVQTITGFEPLAYGVVNQTVPFWTSRGELLLPGSLDLFVSDDETSISVGGVTWRSEPEYTAYAGTYVFTAVLPQRYTVAAGVALPVITVTVQPMGVAIAAAWDGSDAIDFASNTGIDGATRDGSQAEPYIIQSAENLAWLRNQVNSGTTYSGVYFELTDNIELNDMPWIPIGGYNSSNAIDKTKYFVGILNGYGYCVNGLKIDSDLYQYAGLFGYIDDSCAISNLGVNGSVASSYSGGIAYAGGLAGYLNAGTITGCYSNAAVTASVSGRYTYAGGLVGYQNGGEIKACYATGKVDITITGSSSPAYAGGLVGQLSGYGTIKACYATGDVVAINNSNTSAMAGGLVGFRSTGNPINNRISGCFWNKDSTQTIKAGSSAAETVQNPQRGINNTDFDNTLALTLAQTQETEVLSYLNALGAAAGVTWKKGTDGGWPVPVTGLEAPYSSWENGVFDKKSGSGTEASPYLIANWEQLCAFSDSVNNGNNYEGKYIRLTDDIEFPTEVSSIGFVPIGLASGNLINGFPFNGTFDGNSKKIKGLTINRANYNCGLFGYINTSGVVHGVSIVEGSVINNHSHIEAGTGLLAGYCRGKIFYCNVQGDVTGAPGVGSNGGTGGLVGYLNQAQVIGCSARGTVTGTTTYANGTNTGGLIGRVESICIVRSCYASSDITVSAGTSEKTGGLIGYVSNNGTYIDSGYWNRDCTQKVGSVTRDDSAKLGVGDINNGVTSITAKTTAQIKTGAFTDEMNAALNVADRSWRIDSTNAGFPYVSARSVLGGSVSISGSHIVGQSLTADISALTPDTSKGTVYYQWTRGGLHIGEATARTYTITSDDAGYVINVKVTAEYCGGGVSSTNTYAVPGGKNSGPAVDSTPALASKTHNSITVNAISISASNPDNTTVEYAIATSDTIMPSSWQSGTSFGSLSVSTAYYVYARAKESMNGYAGTAKVSQAIMTDAAPPDTATVSFNSNGGSGAMASVSVAKGSYNLPLCQFSRNDYTFAGWKIGNIGTVYLAGATVSLSSDITLYAQWTSNDNGSGGGALGGNVTISGSYVIGQSLAAITTALTPATGKGTLYYKWSSDGVDIEDATSRVYAITSADAGKVINVTVTSQYCSGSVSSANTTTVVVGGKGGGPAVNSAPTLVSKTHNNIIVDAVSISASNPDNTTVEYAITTSDTVMPSSWQSGTTFGGLSASTTYYVYARAKESTNYNAGTAKVSQAITTDAAPPDTATVSFYANGGSGTMVSVSVAKGSYNLPLCQFNRNDYTFAGWKIGNTGTAIYLAGAAVSLSSDITLYAQWTSNDDGSGGGALGGNVTISGSYVVGQSLAVITTALTPATGKGTLYYKWSSDGVDIEDATSRVYAITSADAGKVINVTVTAQYCSGSVSSANTTTVVVGGKGSGPVVNSAPTLVSKTYNNITVDTVSISASNPDDTTVEYAITTSDTVMPSSWQSSTTFGGLSASTTYYVYARAKESTNYYAGTAKVSQAITTDAAPANTATVSFNANGGSGTMASVSVAKGLYNLPLCQFSRNDYTFAGWKIGNTSTTYLAGANVTLSSDIALYAQWTSNDDGSGGGNDGGNGGGSGSGSGGGGGGSGSGEGGSGSGAGGSGGSDSGNDNDTPTPDNSPTTSSPESAPTASAPATIEDTGVYVDGNRVEAGMVTTESNATTVTIDQEMFNKKIETAQGNVTVIIPSETGTAVAELVIKNMVDLAAKDVTLTVQSGNVQYAIPATAVDTSSIFSVLGVDNADRVSVSIVITTELSAAAQAAVDEALQWGGGSLVIPPMEFKMTASCDGKTVDINTFNEFVSRTVEVTEAQARMISTAIIVEPDGTTRHVLTYVYQENGKWYATINSLTNSVYALIYNELSFTDAQGKWYERAVNEMGSRSIISGIGDNLFAGERDITRAEFAAIIVNALGLPADGNGAVFSNISSSAWYFGAIGKAYEYGIVSGVGNGEFDPNRKITRQEAMLMIQRTAKIAGYAGEMGNVGAFSDADSVSDWALEAALWNVGSGLIAGSDGLLRPLDNITRAETATLVLKLLQQAGLIDERMPLSAKTTNTDELISSNPRKEPDAVQMPDDTEADSPDPDGNSGSDGDEGDGLSFPEDDFDIL